MADYNINSDKGRNIANNLKSGESYSAGDGSKWTKGSDGSISVTHNGQTMRGVVGGGSSSGSMSSSNSNSGSVSSGRSSGGSTSGSSSSGGSGRTFRVGADGRAPSEARPGDLVVTGGGTYRIGNDGKGVAVNRNQTTSNYQGSYFNQQQPTRGTVASSQQSQTMRPVQTAGGSGRGDGNYNISSQAGINKANSMQPGEVWKNPGDGTTWAKNQQGEVWVSHPGGEPLRGILGGGSGTSTGSLNTYSVETDKGKQILRELMDGTRKSADVGNGTTWEVINGVPYATQNGKTMPIVSSILGQKSAETLSASAIASMIAAGRYDKKVQDATSKADVFVVNLNGKKSYVTADGKPINTGTQIRTVDEQGLPALARLYQDLQGNYFEGIDTRNNRVEVWTPNKDGRSVYNENLSGKGFYIYNDRIYNSQTGQSVRVDEALPEDALFSYNGRWYDRKGNLTEGVNPLVDQMKIEDGTLNSLIQEFLKQYYDTTDFANYKHMTRDEALGRANETLRSQYDNRLQNTLDGMRTKALNTGFFGQLPTEALYENAAARNEVDLQAAINSLAEELYSNDFNQAYTKFNADRTSQNAALNTLGTAMNAYNNYNAEQRDERQREIANVMDMLNYLYQMQNGIAKNNAEGIPSKGLSDIYNRALSQLNNMQSAYRNN